MMLHENVLSPPSTTRPKNDIDWAVLVLCCAPLLLFRITLLFSPPLMFDYITYWASGHLFLTGAAPYSVAQMFATERLQGWTYADPMVLLCPPWTLPVTAAMASLPFHISQISWISLSVVLNCLSAIGLWIYFGGARQRAWIAILLCTTFLPMGGAEHLGQITTLMLLCLTAFLLLLQRGQHFAAGLFLLGLGFKPQLLYLVALAILLWIVKNRAWSMLGGALLSYGSATLTAVLVNRNSLDYFHNALGAAMGTPCGVGGALRSVFGVQHSWLQFVPSVFGGAWFLYYWFKHQARWDWQTHLPLLLIVSVGSAPYCWYHDYILILPALIVLMVRAAYRSPRLIFAFLLVQVVVLAASQLSRAWMCVASLLWIAFYLLAKSETARSDAERLDAAALDPSGEVASARLQTQEVSIAQ